MVLLVAMYGCECWTKKKAECWRIEAFELWCLESPLDCKEIRPVHPKGNQPWIFIGRTDAEAVTPMLWPPDVKNWLIGKDPDAEKDWRQEEKGTIEDEIVEWHHWLNGHEFEQVLGVGYEQGSLACCCPWGCKQSDMIERLNWTEMNAHNTHTHTHTHTYIYRHTYIFWCIHVYLWAMKTLVFQETLQRYSVHLLLYFCALIGDSLVAQMVKILLSMWESWVWSLSQEDPLEKKMVVHSHILAWKIPWMEMPEGL